MTHQPDPPHQRFRELAALALYDELDAAERDTLERHLAACADCRALGAELRSGLGRLASASPADDLPPAWLDALRGRIAQQERATPVPRSRPPWLGFAAGLAAGLAASVLWVSLANGRSGPEPETVERSPLASTEEVLASAAFARPTPPPLTSSPGPFAPLALLRRER